MTLLSIDEAATFLKVKKRTLYRHPEIPGRVKVGSQIIYVKEYLEQWILGQLGPPGAQVLTQHKPETVKVDEPSRKVYHLNPLFITRRPSAGS